jgi:hypothetical protein
MMSYLLPDGRIFLPRRTEFNGYILDQYEAVEPTHPDAQAAGPWTVPAPPQIVAMYERHLESAKERGDDGVTKG